MKAIALKTFSLFDKTAHAGDVIEVGEWSRDLIKTMSDLKLIKITDEELASLTPPIVNYQNTIKRGETHTREGYREMRARVDGRPHKSLNKQPIEEGVKRSHGIRYPGQKSAFKEKLRKYRTNSE